jgi:hypothetical protein
MAPSTTTPDGPWEPENRHVLVSVQASALQEERMQAAMSNGVVSDSGEEPGKHIRTCRLRRSHIRKTVPWTKGSPQVCSPYRLDTWSIGSRSGAKTSAARRQDRQIADLLDKSRIAMVYRFGSRCGAADGLSRWRSADTCA